MPFDNNTTLSNLSAKNTSVYIRYQSNPIHKLKSSTLNRDVDLKPNVDGGRDYPARKAHGRTV